MIFSTYTQASALEELSVHRGEKVEVLDDSRNWWKVKNRFGATGYVASNMLEVIVKRQKNVAPSGGKRLREKERERERERERFMDSFHSRTREHDELPWSSSSSSPKLCSTSSSQPWNQAWKQTG